MDSEFVVQPQNPCETPVGRRILLALPDRDTRFVFPTQTSADSWAEAVLRFGPSQALESDRFLSLDAFVQQACQAELPPDKKPADFAVRFLWADSVLAAQTETAFLEILAKPGFPATKSQLSFLARLAPLLRDFSDRAARVAGGSTLRQYSPETRDFLALSLNYERFLDTHGCYEPSHCVPSFDGDHHKYILFSPELAFAYNRHAALFERQGTFEIFQIAGQDCCREAVGAATATSVKESEAPEIARPAQAATQRGAPTVLEFGTFRQEFDWVFAACRQLMEKGVKPNGIAISVPTLSPKTKAYLEESASRWAVPIEFRIGAKLSSFPFGQLLNSLARTAAEGLSLSSLRSLFSIGAFSWKDRGAAAALVRFGEKYSIPDDSADRVYMARLWAATFASCGSEKTDDARLFYTELKRTTDALTSAATFDSLRTTLFDFRARFLDESRQSPTLAPTLERTFEELDNLAAWGDGDGEKATPPLATLLALLDSVTYNAPASNLTSVSVFSYQTGVLIASPTHFVLECSQNSLDGFQGWLADFPEEVVDSLAETEVQDRAVLESFDVNRAVFCHAREGLSGFSVPNPWFAMRHAARINMDFPKDQPERSPEVYSSETREENAWFRGDAGSIPGQMPLYLKDAALGNFAEDKSAGAPVLPLAPPLFRAAGRDESRPERLMGLLTALPRGFRDSKVIFTPAKLKAYSLCPFKWLVSLVPDLQARQTNIANLAEGALSHLAISRLFGEIKKSDGEFVAKNIPDYSAALDTILGRAMADILKEYGPSVAPALRAALPKIKHRLTELLGYESEFEAAGWDIGQFEVRLDMDCGAAGAILEGRADRIARRQTESGTVLALIDYKKNNAPRKNEFYLDEDGNLRDVQLAGYTEILASGGSRVETALYWSIEKCKALVVFGPSGKVKTYETFAPERQALQIMLETAAHSVHKAQFMEVRRSGEGCRECEWKALCRAHFALEAS